MIKKTGQILEIYQQPTGKTDAIVMQHDVDYSVCSNKPDQVKCKNDADRKMVKVLDAIPWKDRQWGHFLARNAINTKQKLGLGFDPVDFAKGIFNPVKEGVSKAKKGKMPWQVHYKEGFKLLTDPKLFKGPQKIQGWNGKYCKTL